MWERIPGVNGAGIGMLDMYDQTNTQHRTSMSVLIDRFQHKTLGKRNDSCSKTEKRREAENYSEEAQVMNSNALQRLFYRTFFQIMKFCNYRCWCPFASCT